MILHWPGRLFLLIPITTDYCNIGTNYMYSRCIGTALVYTLHPMLCASICWIFKTHDTPPFQTRLTPLLRAALLLCSNWSCIEGSHLMIMLLWFVGSAARRNGVVCRGTCTVTQWSSVSRLLSWIASSSVRNMATLVHSLWLVTLVSSFLAMLPQIR